MFKEGLGASFPRVVHLRRLVGGVFRVETVAHVAEMADVCVWVGAVMGDECDLVQEEDSPLARRIAWVLLVNLDAAVCVCRARTTPAMGVVVSDCRGDETGLDDELAFLLPEGEENVDRWCGHLCVIVFN